jgi:hypothetical protein
LFVKRFSNRCFGQKERPVDPCTDARIISG